MPLLAMVVVRLEYPIRIRPHDEPWLMIGGILGGIGSALGYYSLSLLGARPLVYLAIWSSWVACHVLASDNAIRIVPLYYPALNAAGGGQLGEGAALELRWWQQIGFNCAFDLTLTFLLPYLLATQSF